MARGCAGWLLLVMALAAGLLVGGCALYMNYPPLEGDTSINNPNYRPMPEVVQIGLNEVTRRYPVEGGYVVNLPKGTTLKTAQWVQAGLGEGARLVGSGGEGMPVFHVTRVWIRGGEARVEVLAPEVQGEARGVVVEMTSSGISGWRTERVRTLARGAVVEPPLYGWSGAGEVEE